MQFFYKRDLKQFFIQMWLESIDLNATNVTYLTKGEFKVLNVTF